MRVSRSIDHPLVLLKQREDNKTAKGCGPMAALKRAQLEEKSEQGKDEWLEKARIDAILGSCRLSLPSVRSGIRCYAEFAGRQLNLKKVARNALLCFTGNMNTGRGHLLPPKLEMLLAWSTLFRSEGTFANYVAHVRTACMLCEVSIKVSSSLEFVGGAAHYLYETGFREPSFSEGKRRN